MTPKEMETFTYREREAREKAALESAWDKIDNKIAITPLGVQRDLIVKLTLLELRMLRQFRRKFG